MLFLGVTFSGFSYEITALSEGYAFLDEETFPDNNINLLNKWIHSFLLDDNEPVLWFFCEKEFYKSDFAVNISLQSDFNSYFLIKDRLVLNLYQALIELSISKYFNHSISKSYILAASRRFFEPRTICQFIEDTCPPRGIK